MTERALAAPATAHDWGAMREPADARPLLEAALAVATENGASFAEARVVECEELRHYTVLGSAADRRIEHDLGIAVRVLVDGVWGFAGRPLESGSTAVEAAGAAVAIARAAAGATRHRLRLPAEPPAAGSYSTAVVEDPFGVPVSVVEALLEQVLSAATEDARVVRAQAGVNAKRQHRYLANSEGSAQDQHLVETGGGLLAVAAADGEVQRRSYPNSFHGDTSARGWEYLAELDLVANAARVGAEAVTLLTAPTAPPGVADLVIGPAQMALQIHESVGHALELDRVLGDERNFAGASFVELASAGSLVYGSPAVTIRADPTVPGTRGSFGFDDEGTPAYGVDLIESGVLREFLSHRDSAARAGRRSTGAARADGWSAPPVCFATNVYLQPGEGSVDELLDQLGEGYYLDDNRSWSIDSRRWSFQFGTEVAWEVRGGRRGRLLRNFSYGGITPQFWGSVEAVGGPETFRTFGLPCGKGEPKQWGFLAHGAAPTLVRQVQTGIAA
ncbi:MAG TPA: TldD/PmbA family protein [Mycobacteriales bacterium]|nr:TldD/PmbA family protein [Mycobacteriales bacterium]